MTAQTVSSCVVCGATTDRFLCGSERHGSGCLGELLRQLGDCAALVDELNTTLSRQSKTGGMSIGFVTNGGDEQPLPLDGGAMESGLLLRDRLASWVRYLWEDNQGQVWHCGGCGVPLSEHAEGPTRTPVDWYLAIPQVDVDNTITALSRWLMRHPSWMALCTGADALYDEIVETIRLAWRAVDTAPGKVYIGLCSAPIVVDDEDQECAEELYAREGDWEKRCPVCLTIHDVRERQSILSMAVEHQYVPMGVLVGLVTDRGHKVTSPIVRSLKSRKRIGAFVAIREGDEGAGVMDRYGFFVRPWTKKDVGMTVLFRVGDVLDAITNRYRHLAA